MIKNYYAYFYPIKFFNHVSPPKLNPSRIIPCSLIPHNPLACPLLYVLNHQVCSSRPKIWGSCVTHRGRRFVFPIEMSFSIESRETQGNVWNSGCPLPLITMTKSPQLPISYPLCWVEQTLVSPDSSPQKLPSLARTKAQSCPLISLSWESGDRAKHISSQPPTMMPLAYPTRP